MEGIKAGEGKGEKKKEKKGKKGEIQQRLLTEQPKSICLGESECKIYRVESEISENQMTMTMLQTPNTDELFLLRPLVSYPVSCSRARCTSGTYTGTNYMGQLI